MNENEIVETAVRTPKLPFAPKTITRALIAATAVVGVGLVALWVKDAKETYPLPDDINDAH